ncbi:MFS efflux transporter [Scheffersomyces coipomensis]|uniref:MFS efflux transporter n=1 Tax=Scheffersomyces coipomensis TaxID=1788519 RepID=UPI00315D0B7A
MSIKSEKEKHKVIVSERIIPHRSELAEKLGDTHFNVLPTKKIISILLVLSAGQIVSFMDQTGITVGLPQIADELNAEETINWAGSASLLANCVCQVLFGRLSDIFGRKTILMSSFLFLTIGDIACSVAQTGYQFYIFRAFAGIGNGGVSSLGMIILSDIVTLEQRGKYQGILGASVGIGNAIGPFIMSAFIKYSTWRGFYYFLAPLGVLVNITIYFLIDDNKKQLDSVLSKTEKFKKIDYLGILTATIALTLILVPLSSGGSIYPWNSAIVISMFSIGGVFFIIFLMVEWKIPELPMVPLKVFKSPSLCILLSCNFLFGAAYYSFLFYLPYYFQIVRGYDEIHTSIFILPLVLSQAAMSTVGGLIITHTGRYIYVVSTGYFLWMLSSIFLIFWNENLHIAYCVLILLLMGVGVGLSFQPSMIAVQANCKKSQRAVVISLRNVLRSFGGAFGITAGSTIISNMLLNKIDIIRDKNIVPITYLDYLQKHVYQKIQVDMLTEDQLLVVKSMYVGSLKYYFIMLIAFMGLCLIGSLFVKDRGLQCIDEEPSHKRDNDIETTGSSSNSSL